ncbi:MAG: Uma2 family endonuclease [Gammaproteobacteria bacterium]
MERIGAPETRDRGYKRALYARYGVKEYWIADPKAQGIEVYGLGADGFELRGSYGAKDRLFSPLFPDLDLPLGEVFSAE